MKVHLFKAGHAEAVYQEHGHYYLDADGCLVNPANGFKVDLMIEQLSEMNIDSHAIYTLQNLNSMYGMMEGINRAVATTFEAAIHRLLLLRGFKGRVVADNHEEVKAGYQYAEILLDHRNLFDWIPPGTILDNFDNKFLDSPDSGTLDCLCSRCLMPIKEFAHRAFDEVLNAEYRFGTNCFLPSSEIHEH